MRCVPSRFWHCAHIYTLMFTLILVLYRCVRTTLGIDLTTILSVEVHCGSVVVVVTFKPGFSAEADKLRALLRAGQVSVWFNAVWNVVSMVLPATGNEGERDNQVYNNEHVAIGLSALLLVSKSPLSIEFHYRIYCIECIASSPCTRLHLPASLVTTRMHGGSPSFSIFLSFFLEHAYIHTSTHTHIHTERERERESNNNDSSSSNSTLLTHRLLNWHTPTPTHTHTKTKTSKKKLLIHARRQLLLHTIYRCSAASPS